MEGLWKETFGDSSEYVSLVFRNYFNPELVAFHEESGKVVSALLGVPYNFVSDSGKNLKGLYLCGLATKRDVRRHGYMSALIENINVKAQKEGFDFSFLIPSGEGLKRYYRDHGYHDSFYKIKENYVKGHIFGGDDSVEVVQYEESLKGKLTDFLLLHELDLHKNTFSFSLIHSEKDWHAVLDEAVLSKEHIYVALRGEEIVGAAFTRHKEEGEKRETLEIKEIKTADVEVERKMLGEIGKIYSESTITIIRDLENVVADGGSQLWNPFFARNNGKSAEYEDVAEIEQPFNISRLAYAMGMVRIFNLDGLLNKIGIENSNSFKGFSKQEMFRLVLRRPVGNRSDALENILDLPEISLTMSLLLE